jgi:hypothetical protein
MARYKGKDGAISAGGGAIGEVESFDLNITVNQIDADVIGEDWTAVCGGKKTATGTVNVLRDPADAGQTALVVGSSVAMILYPEGNTTGLSEITGNFLVTEKAMTVPAGDLVKDVYSIRNDGAITEGTVS